MIDDREGMRVGEGRKERGREREREGDREEEEAISTKQLMGVPEAVRVGEGESKERTGCKNTPCTQKEMDGCTVCTDVLHSSITCRRSESSRHKLGTSCSIWTHRRRLQAVQTG